MRGRAISFCKASASPGKSDVVKFRVRNSGKKATKAKVGWNVFGSNGKSLFYREDAVTLGASGVTDVPFEFNAKELKIGDYSVRGTVQIDRETVLALEQTLSRQWL